jgi:hypothetical protein
MGDINYSIEIDQYANLVSYSMDYTASITVEGMTVNASYTNVMNVDSVNSLVAIAYPKDLDTYVEA